MILQVQKNLPRLPVAALGVALQPGRGQGARGLQDHTSFRQKRNLKEFMENDGKRIIFQNMTSEDLGVEKRLYPSILFLKNKQVVQVSNSNFD